MADLFKNMERKDKDIFAGMDSGKGKDIFKGMGSGKKDIFAGMDSSSGDIFTEAPPPPSNIKKANQYQHSDTWLGKGLEALDYTGNIARSGIMAAIDNDSTTNVWESLKQAASKDRYTSGTDIKDQVLDNMGVKNKRFGKDDGEFQLGDIADVALDVGTEILTDPISYVPVAGWAAKGAGMAGKGSKAASAAGNVSKAANIAAPAMGAIYGAGVSGKDDDLLDVLGNAAKGAAAGYVGAKALPKVGKALATGDDLSKGVESTKNFLENSSSLKGAVKDNANLALEWAKRSINGDKNSSEVLPSLFDNITDQYVKWSGRESYKDFARFKRHAAAGLEKKAAIAAKIAQGREIALNDLDTGERELVDQIMKGAKDEFAKKRNDLLKKQPHINQKIKDAILKNDTYSAIPKDLDGVSAKQFNEITRKANRYVSEEVIPGILADHSEKIAKAVNGFAKHNEDVIDMYNKAKHGDLYKITSKDDALAGVKWHTDDLFRDIDPKDWDKLQSGFDKIKEMKMFKGATPKDGVISARDAGIKADDRYAKYADNFSLHFLDDAEQKALKIVSDYYHTMPTNPLAAGGEKVLQGFDRLTSFMKANMLMGGLTWVKNNYFDNMFKAFNENGIMSSLDSATLGAFHEGVTRDVWDLYRGNLAGKTSNKIYKKLTMEAFEDGVLDRPVFRALMDDDSKRFFMGDKPLQEAVKKDKSLLAKGAEGWVNMLSRSVGQIGSTFEGTSRLSLYKRTRDTLMKSGMDSHEARKMAAKVVSDTFFNYNELTHFESAFLRRVLPFYSFYSKNAPYWIKSAFDPSKASRMSNIEKVRHSIGEKPLEEDLEGIPKYLKQNAPQILKRGKDGSKTYTLSPSFSMFDGFNTVNPSALMQQFVDKSHPLLKTIYELSTGNDLFTDTPLYPSDSKGGKKYLFHRGNKYYPATKILEAMGGEPIVEYSKSGSPFTRHDGLVALDKIASTIFPHPVVDQVAGSAGKISSGKSSIGTEIFNRSGPQQSIEVSRAQEWYLRKEKEKKAREKEMKRRIIEKERRDAKRRGK